MRTAAARSRIAGAVISALLVVGHGASEASEKGASEIEFHDYAMARAYDIPFEQARKAMRASLEDLGLWVEEADEKGYFLAGSKRIGKKKRYEDVRQRALEEQFVPGDVLFGAFVSSFAAPTRVYLSSESNGRLAGRPVRRIGIGPFQTWLFEAFEARLGIRGMPIPREEVDRRAAFAEFGATPAKCANIATEDPLVAENVDVSEPVVIPESKRTWYPPAARYAPDTESSVFLLAMIQEDGFVADVRPLRDESSHRDFAVAAKSNVAWWRYKPVELDGCRFSAYFTVNFNFSR